MIAPWRAHRYSERHGLQTATVLNAVVLVAARAGRVACKRCTVSVQCGPDWCGLLGAVGLPMPCAWAVRAVSSESHVVYNCFEDTFSHSSSSYSNHVANDSYS